MLLKGVFQGKTCHSVLFKNFSKKIFLNSETPMPTLLNTINITLQINTRIELHKILRLQKLKIYSVYVFMKLQMRFKKYKLRWYNEYPRNTSLWNVRLQGCHRVVQAESSFLGNMPSLETSETTKTSISEGINKGIGDDVIS